MEQEIISQNDKFTKIKNTLTFKNVTRYYNGFWICAAVNEILGKIERNINMTTQLIVMCMFIVFVAVLDQEKRDFPAFGLNTERYSGWVLSSCLTSDQIVVHDVRTTFSEHLRLYCVAKIQFQQNCLNRFYTNFKNLNLSNLARWPRCYEDTLNHRKRPLGEAFLTWVSSELNVHRYLSRI